ncbi:MAG: PLP-dependent aminotransferase family protein [Eubacteriales bacterium]
MKKYMSVYEKVKGDIVSGAIKYGQKVPSKRALSDMLGVSVITVEHACEILESEGYISARPRSGYYVEYTTEKFYGSAAVDVKTESAAIVKAAENEYLPFSVYAKAVRTVLGERGENIMKKSPGTGLSELKTAIKNYLFRSRGIDVSEKQIIIGSGAEYLYGTVTELLGSDKVFGVENPSYEKIERVYTSKGIRTEELSLCDDGISSQALWSSRAEVIHVTPYRSFPTGVTASASKKNEYLRWASECGGYIIEDDYESEFSLFAKPFETIFSSDAEGRVIYINTFSKTICPAVRVGYMLLPERLTDEFYKRLGFYSCTVPALEQYVIAALLADGTFERHINKIRRLRRRTFL